MADGYVSKGFTDEYRVYSWHQSYAEVVQLASNELPRYGFTLQKHVGWKRADGSSVEMEPARSQTRRDVFKDLPRNPDWVTVICGDPVDGAWISHLRYVAEPAYP